MTLPSDTKIEGITKSELILLINDAAATGARKALFDIGLHDDNAIHDVKELRNLLDSWRDTKRSIKSTIVKALTVALLGFIAGASALKIKDWIG